jgi:hypothetical protein
VQTSFAMLNKLEVTLDGVQVCMTAANDVLCILHHGKMT